MKRFFIDPKRKIIKSYDDLFYDLYTLDTYSEYVYKNDPYGIILNILAGMISGEKVILLDSGFSKNEIEKLGLNFEEVFFKRKKINIPKVKNEEDFFERIEKNKKYWKLELFTSGTTGRPKKVEHTYETLTRGVKKDINFKNNIWAFAYNPTHFAGLQVLFQALLNMNTIIYIFDLEPSLIPGIFDSITHISATPTYYRKIISYFSGKSFSKVKRVTLGGEKFDSLLIEDLKKIFPNAKVRNVYASTEAGSLFSSKGDIFKIGNRIKDKIKIEDGELLIHKDLLGYSTDFKLNGKWYKTGDLVEKINENEFKFIARKDEMINVGGYKVNPHEVENEIKKIEGIKDALVKARKNRITGNILVVEIEYNGNLNKEELEKVILDRLSKTLQSWKIPRIYKIVNNIKQTRTGKKTRR